MKNRVFVRCSGTAERKDAMSLTNQKPLPPKTLEHFLHERVKELSCLYGIAKLIEQSAHSIDRIFSGTAEIIPPSWQFPEITCARIRLDDRVYCSSGFCESPWVQTAPIKVFGESTGLVEVFYLEQMPESDEGPFLKEERALIDAIAERLGTACEHIRTLEQLKKEQQALKNMNIALHEVISKVQEEKETISRRLSEKVDRLVMPMIHEIEKRLSKEDRAYGELLKETLEELTAPYAPRYSQMFARLTPIEIQICTMIRNGMTSKEIARLRNCSPATIARHRENIRRKLGIAHRDINLTTYLQSEMSQTTH